MEGEEYEAVAVRIGLHGSSRHLIVASSSHILLLGLFEDLSIFDCAQQHLDLDGTKLPT